MWCSPSIFLNLLLLLYLFFFLRCWWFRFPFILQLLLLPLAICRYKFHDGCVMVYYQLLLLTDKKRGKHQNGDGKKGRQQRVKKNPNCLLLHILKPFCSWSYYETACACMMPFFPACFICFSNSDNILKNLMSSIMWRKRRIRLFCCFPFCLTNPIVLLCSINFRGEEAEKLEFVKHACWWAWTSSPWIWVDHDTRHKLKARVGTKNRDK